MKGLYSTAENYCQFSAIAHMYTNPSLVSFIRIPVCFGGLGRVIVVSLFFKIYMPTFGDCVKFVSVTSLDVPPPFSCAARWADRSGLVTALTTCVQV